MNVQNKRRKQRGRDINGILLLDKPSGITSNDALQIVKRLFNATKAGHTGSLDKAATGLLPICFGEATKFTSWLLDANKRYLARCRLGIETATGDAEGEILSKRPVPSLTEADIRIVLKEFEGDIEQVPPMYSALKHKGQRLYKLAYQGLEVEREPRTISIYSIDLLSYADEVMEIDVRCSKGTYIRTLAEDIGKRLGCGAHVCALVRTEAGPFTQDQMINLNKLSELADISINELDNLLLPIDTVMQGIPEVVMAESVAMYFDQGQAVIVPRAPTSGMLRIYNQDHDFLGIGEVLDDGRIAPRKLVNNHRRRKTNG